VYFEDTLLAVWRHGWQRRGQGFTEVLEETTDHRKIYRLVQTGRYGVSSLPAVVVALVSAVGALLFCFY